MQININLASIKFGLKFWHLYFTLLTLFMVAGHIMTGMDMSEGRVVFYSSTGLVLGLLLMFLAVVACSEKLWGDPIFEQPRNDPW